MTSKQISLRKYRSTTPLSLNLTTYLPTQHKLLCFIGRTSHSSLTASLITNPKDRHYKFNPVGLLDNSIAPEDRAWVGAQTESTPSLYKSEELKIDHQPASSTSERCALAYTLLYSTFNLVTFTPDSSRCHQLFNTSQSPHQKLRPCRMKSTTRSGLSKRMKHA
jgi:hypothetical protein